MIESKIKIGASMPKQIAWLIVIVLAAVAAFFIWQYFTDVKLPDVQMSTFGSETVRARVTEVIEEGTIDLGGQAQPYQIVRVELLEGEYRGILMEVDYGKRQIRTDD